MSSFVIPKLEDAESRLDSLFTECGFASDHPAMQDWVAIKFALKSTRHNSVEPRCATCKEDHEDHIVFESIGDDVEQHSIPITIDSAVKFLLDIQKRHPDRCFYICRRLAQQEIEEVQKKEECHI